MKTEYNVDEIRKLVQGIIADIDGTKNIDDIDFFHKPDKAEVREIIDNLFRIVYPGYFRERSFKIYNPEHGFAVILEDVFYHLNKQVAQALDFCRLRGVMTGEERAREAYRITREFMRRLPAIRRLAETDLLAAYDGDPAAGCLEEIILAYPGLMASTVYRLAHELYLLRVPVLPRLMTEYAHAETGIDIHPGAVIGRSFFIDHGTGIVIGETAIIGQNVPGRAEAFGKKEASHYRRQCDHLRRSVHSGRGNGNRRQLHYRRKYLHYLIGAGRYPGDGKESRNGIPFSGQPPSEGGGKARG